jgi:DNA-directed RNA polymerase specialized sigma24 family protein
MSDSAQAADTMESAVAQVSRYLDRGEVAVFSRDVHGLLMIAFQRSLRRRASRMRRLETLGGSEELAAWAVDRKWANRVNARIELEEIVARLGRRSQNILALRYVGHTWNETAQVLATPVAAVRSAFWRDMARVRRELKTNPLGSKEKSRIG